MNKAKQCLGLLVPLVFTLATLSGCDQISSFFNKSGSKSNLNKEKISSTPVESTPVPSLAPPSIDSNVPLPADVLARVGNWTLTAKDFEERLKGLKEVFPDFDVNVPENKRLILEELVRQQLLVREAEETGAAKKKEIVDAVEEFRRSLLVRDAATKLTEGIKVTDLEAQEFYNQNKDNPALTEPAEYHLREIVMSTQSGAKEVLVDLLKGADFAEMAKARSKGKTAANGGDLGTVKTFEFPQMEAAVASLEAGDISNVFKGPSGDYYIVKVEEKKGGKQKDFAAVKEDIITFLTQSKQQSVIESHLKELQQKYGAKINENFLSDKGVKP